MSLASGQIDATQRRDLYGVVYALSGTLRSRQDGIPDAELRWATRPFTGGPTGERYEHYFTLPEQITEELPFRLGDVPPLFPFPLSVRNLPFQHAESIFTTIVDEDYAWEGSEATLWAGYLKPGQEPGDLGAEDWEPLRTRGQLGSPRDISLDGFTVQLLSRDTSRTTRIHYPSASREDWPNVDPDDEGRVIPIVVGSPDSWVRAIRVDCGVRGLTLQRVSEGQDQVTIPSDHPGVEDLEGKQVYVHRLGTVKTVSSVSVTGQGATLTLDSPFDFEVPRGAVVQEKREFYDILPSLNPHEVSPTQLVAVAHETSDGRIIPIPSSVGATTTTAGDPPFGFYRLIRLQDDPGGGPITGVQPFAVEAVDLPPPTIELEGGAITQQPDFATNEQIESTKINIPTGPAGASAAFDGNEDTGASIPSSGGSGGNSITFTFPGITGGNFDNGDTTRSIIRFKVQGEVEVIVPPSTSIATVTGALGGSSYQFILPTAQDFDADVRFIEQGNGAVVYSVEWEHDLATSIDLTRTDDVVLDPASQDVTEGETVYNLVPSKSILVKLAHSEVNTSSARSFDFSPFGAAGDRRADPASVFANLQFLLMERHEPGSGWVGGGPFGNTGFSEEPDRYERFINLESYEAAHAKYAEHDIRLNFVIQDFTPWEDLERTLALQSRSYAFYGPQGHELHYIEDPEDVSAIAPAASFRYPGVPRANAIVGSATFERTSPADILNSVDIRYWRRWLLSRSVPAEERLRGFIQVSNAESVAVFGERRADAPFELPAIAPQLHTASHGDPGYDHEAHARLIGDFIVKRHGFARTRFAFDTAWNAHGLRRGSLIRVVFAAAPGVFRNVMCEVESLKVSPINSERRTIVARSVSPPLKGLAPAFRWSDIFEPGDTWADRITGAYDRWNQYFATAPGGD